MASDINRDTMNDIYIETINKLCEEGKELNDTIELENYHFTLNNIDENISNVRNMSISYLMAELIWYFGARNDVEFISKFASMWKRISDDGITNNSAYGYILRKKHGFDQIEKIIELLEKDPDTRRAVLNLNCANEYVIETKDEPCTIALQFLIREGKLDCTTMMRSNDIWFGLPYDVIYFTTLQKYIANRLEVGYGKYHHFATSLHCYKKDINKIHNIYTREKSSMNSSSANMKINERDFFKCHSEIEKLVLESKDPKKDIITICEKYGVLY